jgi:3-dehydroquinate synthase
LPAEVPADVEPEILLETMRRDKKVAADRLTFVLPEAVGRVRVVRGVAAEDVLAVLKH